MSTMKITFVTLEVSDVTEQCFYRWEIYLYDSEALRKERDDPLDAIVFHYPYNLSEEHVLFTCGHLMSTSKFCRDLFSEDTRYLLAYSQFTYAGFSNILKVIYTIDRYL